VNFWGQGNKEGSPRLPLGEERTNILLLACCYQEGSNPKGNTPRQTARNPAKSDHAPPAGTQQSPLSPRTRMYDNEPEVEGPASF
jgi:hypothetical protein